MLFSLTFVHLFMTTLVYSISGAGMELSFHDGTVRDVVFMQDLSNHSSLMISGGAGDCKIYASDCQTGVPIRALTGHTGRKMFGSLRNRKWKIALYCGRYTVERR